MKGASPMARSKKPLSALVHTPQRYLRSVHLERDASSEDALDGYVLSAQARQVLGRIGDGLRHGEICRAWTLTGPYGSGKSAFALFLAELLAPPQGLACRSARERLRQEDPQLLDHILGALSRGGSEPEGLLPVLLTGRRASLAAGLLGALKQSLARLPRSSGVSRATKEINTALAAGDGEALDRGAAVAGILGRTADIVAASGAGYAGVVVIADELGQFLEFAARQDMGSEIYLLQELAEAANRTSDSTTVIVGVLHQSFEEYVRHLDSVARNEWAKVQGRFEDIAFQESPDQMMRLLGASIDFAPDRGTSSVKQHVAHVAKDGTGRGIVPSVMRDADFQRLAERCYPLHPSTVAALPHLFRRFGQNERSLFSYVASLEPYGLQDLIRERDLNPDNPYFIRLYDVFDYLAANLGPTLHLHRDARGWVQAADLLDRHAELSEVEIRVIKTIGVLVVLERICHFEASGDAIEYCVIGDGVSPDQVRAALVSLATRSIVVYRQFSQTYRLWEGSDINIDELLNEARRSTHGGASPAQVIQKYIPPRPLVARRHSYVTGALRFFDVVYVDQASLAGIPPSGSGHADGVVVCCLPGTSASVSDFTRWASTDGPAARPDVVLAVPQRFEKLSSAIHELQALHWVRDHTAGLRDDAVASRELAERVAQVEQVLSWSMQRLIDPRDPPTGGACHWYYRGVRREIGTQAGVNGLLSEVCDELYPKSPRIQNELINRRELSSTVAAARNRLLGKMVECAPQPALGIDGYPPERSIYESLLRSTGIHRQQGAAWAFTDPDPRADHDLSSAWQWIDAMLLAHEGERVPLRHVADALSRPPYGLLQGPMPVLLCAYLLAHEAEVALYENDGFVPELSAAILERMARSVDGFDLQFFRVEGLRLQLLARLVRSLSRDSEGLDGSRSQLLESVRQLCFFANHLPHYTRYTSRLGPATKRVRETLLEARDPFWLLFEGLPEACGLPPLQVEQTEGTPSVEPFLTELRNALVELRDAHDQLLRNIEGLLYDAFELPEADGDGRELLACRAQAMLDICVEHGLRAFLVRAADGHLPHREWLEGIATLLAKKTPRDWNDGDVNRFELELADVRRRFSHLEELAVAMGNTGALPPGTAAYRLSVTSVGRGENAHVVLILPGRTEAISDLKERLRVTLQGGASDDAVAALASLAEELISAAQDRGRAEASGKLRR